MIGAFSGLILTLAFSDECGAVMGQFSISQKTVLSCFSVSRAQPHLPQLSKHEEVLRRTAYKDHLGLTLDYSVDDLLARAVAFEDLLLEAQMAWRPPKKEDAEAAPADPSCQLVAERAPAAPAAGEAPNVDDALLDDELIDNDEPQLRLAL